MDVEKTIEFILEQQAHIASVQAHTAELAAKHEAEMARHEAQMARLDARLRRAIRLAVQEARDERRRRREWDAELRQRIVLNEQMMDRLGDKIDKLSDKIDQYVTASLHPGNGNQS